MIKKLVLLPIVLLLLIPIASAQVTVERDLPDQVSCNEKFNVVLSIKIGENKPNGVIIVEHIPEGFSYVSSDPEGVFMEETKELKWVFYGAEVEDRTITYTLKAPSETKTATFDGEVKTILGTEKIQGDAKVEIAAKATLTPTPTKKAPGFELGIAIGALLLILVLKRKF